MYDELFEIHGIVCDYSDLLFVVASHKNQHFIPKVYLKPFSLNGEGAAINLYNLDRAKSIKNVPLKSQCSKPFFYGADLTLERLLGKFEGHYGQIVWRLDHKGHQLTDDDLFSLRRFVYLQYRRTEAAAIHTTLAMREMYDVVSRNETIPSLKEQMRFAILLGMKTFAETMDHIEDLKVALIRNESKTPFITSDDPAILANRWHQQDSRTQGRSWGIQNAGVLLLLPLSSNIFYVVYDGDVYSLQNIGGWINTKNTRDIESLNEHQLLNSFANIYFSDWEARADLINLVRTLDVRRLSSRHQLVLAKLTQTDGWGNHYHVVPKENHELDGEYLMHLQSTFPQPSRWPSFIKFRTKRRIYTNGTGLDFLRASAVLRQPRTVQPFSQVS